MPRKVAASSHFQSLTSLSWLTDATNPDAFDAARAAIKPSWALLMVTLFFSLMSQSSMDCKISMIHTIKMRYMYIKITHKIIRYDRTCLITTNYKQWWIIWVENTRIKLVSAAIQLMHTLAVMSWSKRPHLHGIFTYRGEIVTRSIPTNRLNILYVSLCMNRSSYYSESNTVKHNANCNTIWQH